MGDESLKYFTHVSKAYETLYDNQKRAVYDDDSISDEDFFTIQVGPLKINLFVMFFITAGLSGAYFLNKKFGTGQDKSGACPIDHKNREEMRQIMVKNK